MAGKRGLDRSRLTLGQRCDGKVRQGARRGERCLNPHLPGIGQCRYHGGTLPQNAEIARNTRLDDAVRRARVPLIDANDEEATGDGAIAGEIRRTVAWIRYCERMIDDLESDSDVIWGMSERETKVSTGKPVVTRQNGKIESSDDSYEITRYGASINGWVARLEWNRQQLLRVSKIWIDAGFDAKRIEIEQHYVEMLDRAIVMAMVSMGHSASDPAVRKAIYDALMAVAGQQSQRREIGA